MGDPVYMRDMARWFEVIKRGGIKPQYCQTAR
jgi:hypothetical protein